MPTVGSFGRTLLFRIVLPAAVWLAMPGLAWAPFTCTAEARERFANVSGFDFEVSETDCDTVAKDASISVQDGPHEQNSALKYGPTGVNALPVITSVGPHEVQISIPRISDLIFRRDKLADLSVTYRIGVIEYPDQPIE